MVFRISVNLLSGIYQAGEVSDRRDGEWPPHPARVFSALVAAARSEADRDALRWLEKQPPPRVRAGHVVAEQRRENYVVTNRIQAGKSGNLTHPGRTNGLRARAHVIPSSPQVAIDWDEDPDRGMLAHLDEMARRVPYLGRSTGIALISAAVTGASEQTGGFDDLPLYEPCSFLEQELSMRVPYDGFLDELDAQYDADRPAWEVSRYCGYRRRREVAVVETATTPSVYTDVMVFGFNGLAPDGRLLVRFTEALRSHALRQAGDQAPDVLHGHGADGRPHVAYLGLPDVGGNHADGHLLGLAVAVPALPPAERAVVLRALLGKSTGESENVSRTLQLRVPRIGLVELEHRPGLVRPWGATPERWRQGSRRWVSASPVMLDRYPKGGRSVEDEIRASLLRVGLPDPLEVTLDQRPLQPGAIDLRPNELPAKGCRLYRHVALTFEEKVAGPVLVGAGRYLGVGLFSPAFEAGGGAGEQTSTRARSRAGARNSGGRNV